MAFIVQEMTVRLGAVTKRGHAELIDTRFDRFWGFFAMADLVFGNLLTLVTEFIAVRAGLGFFGVPAALAVLGAFLVVVVVVVALTRRYWTWERITHPFDGHTQRRLVDHTQRTRRAAPRSWLCQPRRHAMPALATKTAAIG
jgi:hypothetical protein